jgi:hypothetical protein
MVFPSTNNTPSSRVDDYILSFFNKNAIGKPGYSQETTQGEYTKTPRHSSREKVSYKEGRISSTGG